MHQVFPWVRLYATQAGDVLLMASMNKLPILPAVQTMTDPILNEVLSKLGIDDINYLALMELLSESDIAFIAKTYPTYIHDIDRPSLSHHALRSFFLEESANLNLLIDPSLARHLPNERHAVVASMFQKIVNSGGIQRTICGLSSDMIESPLCLLRQQAYQYKQWKEAESLDAKLQAYAVLRKHRLIEKNDYKELISGAEGPYATDNTRDTLVREMIKDGAHDHVKEILTKWVEMKLIGPSLQAKWLEFSKFWQERQAKVLSGDISTELAP
jgi:hypothetical protein